MIAVMCTSKIAHNDEITKSINDMKTEQTEIKRGDYVEIIPADNHTDYIKSHYGKQHKVTSVIDSIGVVNYCKLKGIKGYGPESSIRKV